MDFFEKKYLQILLSHFQLKHYVGTRTKFYNVQKQIHYDVLFSELKKKTLMRVEIQEKRIEKL